MRRLRSLSVKRLFCAVKGRLGLECLGAARRRAEEGTVPRPRADCVMDWGPTSSFKPLAHRPVSSANLCCPPSPVMLFLVLECSILFMNP